MEILKKVGFPEREFFEQKLKEVEEIKIFVDAQWTKLDSNEVEYEDIAAIVEEKESDIIHKYLSSGLLLPFIQEVVDNPENKQFDVSKIAISEENDLFLNEYNKKVMSIFFSDTKTELAIRKEISWYNLMLGFRIEKEVDNNSIVLLAGILKDL